MVDFKSAIKKPFTNLKTLLLGIIIAGIPFLSFLIDGYGIKTAHATMKGDNKLVPWSSGAIDMFVKSLMVLVISIIYSIFFLFMFLVSLLIISIPFFIILYFGIVLLADIISIFFIGLILLLALFLLLFFYIFPMALMFFAFNNELSDSLKFKQIMRMSFNKKYFISWIIAGLWFFIILIFVLLIWALGIFIPNPFGILFIYLAAGILSYLSTVTSFTIFAETYNELK